MTKSTGKAAKPKARTRVERNIYTVPRLDARDRPIEVFQIGYRDSTSRQRWHTMGESDGIMAARAKRDELLGRKSQGETVVPDAKVRFGVAADGWLAGPVASLAPNTREKYKSHVENHLRRRWGNSRLDAITPEHFKVLVSEMRAAGKSEWTITGVVNVAVQVYKFARVRMGYRGDLPTDGLWHTEKPKGKPRAKRRLFSPAELGQTLRAAYEPSRTIFLTSSVTGSRLSETLGLIVPDLALPVSLAEAATMGDDLEAELRFEHQVDTHGNRVQLKTEEAQRIVPIPGALAARLVARILASAEDRNPRTPFIFCTASGHALSQRNVIRELRRAMRNAVDEEGQRTFPALHELDAHGVPICTGEKYCRCNVAPEPGAVPTFHSFRHTLASSGIAAGDTAEVMSWLLGHKDANVTRAVYIQEIKDAERKAMLRAKLTARSGSAMEAAKGSEGQEREGAEVAGAR